MNKKYGLYLLIVSIVLIIFGIIMIYSSSSIWASYKYNDSFRYVKHQLLFFIIGLILIFFISKIDYKKYLRYSSYIFLFSIILLILVLIPGIGSIRNGSRSWFGIGSFGIQPSEFSKLSLIILTSKYLSKQDKNTWESIIPILLLLFIIFGLIMLQPDFGTGMIIILSIISLLFVSGVNIKFFIGLFLLGIFGIVGLIIIAPYRVKRITSFINPWKDPLGTGFQIIQSLYAIGPGEHSIIR